LQAFTAFAVSTPTDYAAIEQAIERLAYATRVAVPDPLARAYMIARAALLLVLHAKNANAAAELAYKMGDEFSTLNISDKRP
jgi:uncharacterized lipoprotein YmbA